MTEEIVYFPNTRTSTTYHRERMIKLNVMTNCGNKVSYSGLTARLPHSWAVKVGQPCKECFK